MTRETATGRKLKRKKKRVRRAFRPCRKKTAKTRPTELRKERKSVGGMDVMSFPHKVIKDGLEVVVGRSDLLDLHLILDKQ
jgi:hypothetical protein